MKKAIPLISIILALLTSQVFAIRMFTTWQDLQDSSDFIVWARVANVEKINEGEYKTIFNICKIYKGTPPQDLSFYWKDTKGHDGQFHRFYKNEVSSEFILFAKREGNGYSLFKERFMKKREFSNKDEKYKIYSAVSMFYVKELPPELESKAIKHPGRETNYLEWEDIRDWLEKKYHSKTANQQVDPIVTTPVDEVKAQSTQGHP